MKKLNREGKTIHESKFYICLIRGYGKPGASFINNVHIGWNEHDVRQNVKFYKRHHMYGLKKKDFIYSIKRCDNYERIILKSNQKWIRETKNKK